jgi:hypothetical protein
MNEWYVEKVHHFFPQNLEQCKKYTFIVEVTIKHKPRMEIGKSEHSTAAKTRKNSKIFSESDYETNDGMLTTVWGPAAWHFLHTMSFNYPVHPTEEQKVEYRQFVLSLKHVLPCGKCRKNLRKNFKVLPLTMDKMENRTTFSKYIYDLHELINKMLCKKSHLTYEDVRERYEHFRSRCTLPYNVMKKAKMKLNVHKKTRRNKKEKGCTEPLYGDKSKCVIQIVPQMKKCETFQIDKQCIKQKLTTETNENNV